MIKREPGQSLASYEALNVSCEASQAAIDSNWEVTRLKNELRKAKAVQRAAEIAYKAALDYYLSVPFSSEES